MVGNGMPEERASAIRESVLAMPKSERIQLQGVHGEMDALPVTVQVTKSEQKDKF